MVSGQNNLAHVKIGNQTWTANNLDVFAFQNGDAIPQALSVAEWEQAAKNQKPAWCYYNFDPANKEKYGKLYNLYAVTDSRGLAPEGWHVPSIEEWKTLVESLGGKIQHDYFEKNKDVAKYLKSQSGWIHPYTDKANNGDNTSGFNAYASGLAKDEASGSQESIFINQSHNAFFWTSSSFSSVLYRAVRLDAPHYIQEISSSKGTGMVVRLVKD